MRGLSLIDGAALLVTPFHSPGHVMDPFPWSLAVTSLFVLAGPLLAQEQELGERVRDQLIRQPASGAVVAAVHGDSLVLLEAFGHIDQTRTREMSVEQPFYLGTAGDALLGALAVRMALEGVVELGAPVSRWAPELPARVGQATLAQLLTHTAGMDDSPLLSRRPGEAPEDLPPEREVELLSDHALVTDPGMIRSDSRYSLLVAGHVLASAAGRPVARLLEEEIFQAAAMGETTLATQSAIQRGAPPGFVWSRSPDAPFEPASLPRDDVLAAHLRGWGTGPDLARLLTLWLGSPDTPLAQALERSSLPVVADPTDPDGTLRFGLGWQTREFGPWREARAVGGGAGYSVAIRVVPELRLGVIVLTNGGGTHMMAASSQLLERLAEELTGEEIPDSPDAPAEPEAQRRADGSPEVHTGAPAEARDLVPVPVVPSPEPVLTPGPEHAGRYRNGSEVLVLVETDGALAADMNTPEPLEIRVHDHGVLTGHIADGREGLRVRMVRDREGRVYLLLREKAFLLEEAGG